MLCCPQTPLMKLRRTRSTFRNIRPPSPLRVTMKPSRTACSTSARRRISSMEIRSGRANNGVLTRLWDPAPLNLAGRLQTALAAAKNIPCRQAAASASRARRFTTHCFVRAQIWMRVRILRLWTGVRTPSRPTMWMLGWMQRWIRAALTLCSRTIPNTRCSFLRRLRMWRGAAADTRSQFMCMANRCRKASPINRAVRSPR